MRSIGRARGHGQALVEFALVFPLFLILLFSIITFGLYVFYNQQLANAAREAARYAAVHTSTAQCPTVGQLDPPDTLKPLKYIRCDAPELGWTRLTNAARSKVWGMAPDQVSLTACYSGFVDQENNYDALPIDPNTSLHNTFSNCTMHGVDPRTSPSSLDCPALLSVPLGVAPPMTTKADGDDKASDIAVAVGNNVPYATTVTVYTCFQWKPPMAGFVIIPSQITLRAVVTEALQRQQ
jgi:TadE-like protein